MASRGSNRTRFLLVTLLVTSLLLITLDLRGVSVISSIRSATSNFLSPVQRIGSNFLSPIGTFFSDIANVGRTRSKIAKLESENQDLKSQLVANSQLQGELKQLKGVLDLAGKARLTVVNARVISKGGTATFGETYVIDQGSKAGIQRDMTVISAGGLVGVVKSTTTNSAVVLLMSDPSFRIGVRLAGSQDMGILSGQGEGRYLLEMLSATGKVANGDVLLSRGSAGDRPFIPGIPIGTVKSVENNIGQLTKRAQVEGFVDLNSVSIVSVVIKSSGSNPGDALVPKAPAPAPTVTIYVTPTPSPTK